MAANLSPLWFVSQSLEVITLALLQKREYALLHPKEEHILVNSHHCRKHNSDE
jgi:hypothetical protein